MIFNIHLLKLSLNKKFNNLKFELGNIGESKLLLISSIKVMDEYFETKKKVEQKKESFHSGLRRILGIQKIRDQSYGITSIHEKKLANQ